MNFHSAAEPPSRPAAKPPSILLTIDVEDWFQVENFKDYIPLSSWQSHKLRVEKNTHGLLNLFDSVRIQSKSQNPKSKNQCTFFILGWVAERLPHLVREINTRGHEVASHGYAHKLCTECSYEELGKDLVHSKRLLEDIIGEPVHGYRAPSFSINTDILTLIKDSGYLYDSSYNSFGMHERYGKVDLNDNAKNGIGIRISKIENRKSKIFYELPISNISFGNHVLPWGGGGYFRLTPFSIFRLGMQSILRKENAYLFYCHPWEFDEKQPRVTRASLFFKLRHYVNIDRTQKKIIKLIESFRDCSFITCKQYLDSII